MHVLHFSNKPAYPRIDGGSIAISQLLLGLLSNADWHVTHFTLSTQKHPFNKKAYPTTLQAKAIHNFSIDTSLSVIGALTSMAKNESYNVSRFYDKKVAEKIELQLKKQSFDYVILESIFLLPYSNLFKKYNAKVIVRSHNVEHHLWEHQADNCQQPVKKIYLNKLAKQLKKYEVSALTEVDGIMAISAEDAVFFQERLPHIPIEIIPTSFSVKASQNNYALNDFYFLGAMDWKPNNEGVEWLKSAVFPLITSDFQFHLAGKNLVCNAATTASIQCHGEIKDAAEFITNHGICLIPIKSGSGIKIKLLENMAMGKPIITTTEGARGVNLEHNKHVLIADTPEQFAAAMNLLKSDTEKRIQLGKAARSFVIDNFGEEKISNRIVEFIQSI